MTEQQLATLNVGDTVSYIGRDNIRGKASYIDGGLIDFYQEFDTIMVNGVRQDKINKGYLFQKVSYTLLTLIKDSPVFPMPIVIPTIPSSDACIAEIIDVLKKYGKI